MRAPLAPRRPLLPCDVPATLASLLIAIVLVAGILALGLRLVARSLPPGPAPSKLDQQHQPLVRR